ncbi:MAG: glutathione S-transferase, partial [Xanthobacteraceae bacterium]
MPLRLLIGNKNYSSWSLRPWLAMKATGIAFEEALIPLNSPDFRTRVSALSGGEVRGSVPVLIDGEVRVWETLAILEYLAEKFPEARLWPQSPAARAYARAISAEMHSGFQPLRRHLPMNVRRPVKHRALDAAVMADVARIDAVWSECRARFGAGGA